MTSRAVVRGCAAFALALAAGSAAAQAPDSPRWDPPPEMAVLSDLAGNWQVAIEMRPTIGAEPIRSTTTSRIERLFAGAFIQQDLELPLPQGRPGRMRIVAGYDKFRRVYRLNVLSDLDALSDVFEGVRANDRLVLSNVPTGTATYYPNRPTQAVHARLILADVSASSFVFENAVSIDGGGTWQDLLVLRFTRLPEVPPAPCTDAHYRALDFWLGEWAVTTIKGQQAGHNVVSSVLDGCVVTEDWQDVRGESGRGTHRFDVQSGRWLQTWVDNRGRTMELVGVPREGAMQWTRTEPSGALERGEVRRVSADRLEQQGERSVDQGRTWTPLFHFVYTRVPRGKK